MKTTLVLIAAAMLAGCAKPKSMPDNLDINVPQDSKIAVAMDANGHPIGATIYQVAKVPTPQEAPWAAELRQLAKEKKLVWRIDFIYHIPTFAYYGLAEQSEQSMGVMYVEDGRLPFYEVRGRTLEEAGHKLTQAIRHGDLHQPYHQPPQCNPPISGGSSNQPDNYCTN